MPAIDVFRLNHSITFLPLPALPDGIAVGLQSRGRCFTGVRGPAPLGLPTMERRNANCAVYKGAPALWQPRLRYACAGLLNLET